MSLLAKGCTLGLVILVTVLTANVLTRAIVQLVKHPAIRERLDALFPAGETRGEGFSETVGRFLGTAMFSFLFLLVVMTLAELAGLKSLGGALEMLWGLALRLISVSAALAIGCLGVLGARTSSTAATGPTSSPLTMPGYASLGLIVVTTILAIDLLTAAASSITWIAILVLLGVLLMPAREYLLDIWAGFALEHYGIRNVRLDSQEMKIVTVGFLNSTLETPTLERPQHPNRVLLAAHFQKERDGGLLSDPKT